MDIRDLSSLAAIKKKVRMLTMATSEDLLTEENLENYINTYVLYGLPTDLRLFKLRGQVTFYTQPNIDTYSTETTDVNDALYDFDNKYMTIHQPVYVQGIQAFYTQYPSVFYGNFPILSTAVKTTNTGNGLAGPFTGTLTQRPVMQNTLIFQCLDGAGTAMVLKDQPIDNVTGYLTLPNKVATAGNNNGTINYLTGQYSVTFPAATQNATNNPVIATGYYYIPGMPTSVLYYQNKFVVRPVPDKVYPITLEVDMLPTYFLSGANSQQPDLKQWWQLIAYGAAILVLQDRMDTDTVEFLRPEYENQLRAVNSVNLVQLCNERTVTIYTQSKNYGWGWYNQNWPF